MTDSPHALATGLISVWVLAGSLIASAATAEPWMTPGDLRLRHDVQLLADAGLIRSPVSTWPNSWPQIAREVLAVDEAGLRAPQQLALARLRGLARDAMQTGEARLHGQASAAEKPTAIRTFENTPREEGEISAAASFMGTRFAWRAQATAVADASDDKTYRPDGTYLGVTLGNWMLSAGYLDQWWGPGWEGSLILSNNARPVPSLSIERNYADPFETKWLSWIGPWRLSFRIGELEGDRDDFPNTRFFAMRVNFRPLDSLEIGISRSAQFCGDGRPCGFSEFWDLFIGNDNDQPAEEQPGNQLAGFDARWTLPGNRVPIALYGQMIGEDEAGFLPSKYLGLFGVEVWGAMGDGSWRAHVEYADTTCNFSRQNPTFGCAYNNSIYSDGYTYYDRSIGHAMGGDSRMLSFGAFYVDPKGHLWNALVRTVELNREGVNGSHPITPLPMDLTNVELSTTRDYDFGTIRVGLGWDSVDEAPGVEAEDDVRGFVEWRRAF